MIKHVTEITITGGLPDEGFPGGGPARASIGGKEILRFPNMVPDGFRLFIRKYARRVGAELIVYGGLPDRGPDRELQRTVLLRELQRRDEWLRSAQLRGPKPPKEECDERDD